jgi:hypothetical protein
MGYVMVTSPCVGCGNIFSYHPNKVPSVSLDGGPRQPICQACVDRMNPMRKKNGVPLIKPLPGAYEPADENEVIWND